MDPSHWRQTRWMLCVEALVLITLGVVGLLGVFNASPRGTGTSALGLDMTPALSATILAVGVVATVCMLHRRLAMVFSAVVAVVAVFMVIVSAVAAVHEDPGPMGFTVGVTLLYAVLFSYNLAIAMWLIPDHIEGPAWVHRRRSNGHPGHDESAGSSS
jgi:hypothetical protein